MRTFLLTILILSSTACNYNDSYQRTYVISQSNETAAEAEVVTEPLED